MKFNDSGKYCSILNSIRFGLEAVRSTEVVARINNEQYKELHDLNTSKGLINIPAAAKNYQETIKGPYPF